MEYPQRLSHLEVQEVTTERNPNMGEKFTKERHEAFRKEQDEKAAKEAEELREKMEKESARRAKKCEPTGRAASRKGNLWQHEPLSKRSATRT